MQTAQLSPHAKTGIKSASWRPAGLLLPWLALVMLAGAGCSSPGQAHVRQSAETSAACPATHFGTIGLIVSADPTEFIFTYPKTTTEAFITGAKKTWNFVEPEKSGAADIITRIVAPTVGNRNVAGTERATPGLPYPQGW